MIFLFPLAVFGLSFCRVEVYNNSDIQKGFIDSYLSQKVFEILTETGWVNDCKTGKTIRVIVEKVTFKGSSISNNRFSGYTFRIEFTIELPKKKFHYTLSRYVALPNPSEGTLPIRGAFIDVLESYQINIKRDLLQYEKQLKER
ncbi:MAG TPA: hypothetical protein EYO62_00630 [Aquificales bacterium]|nr:hypothetical protein [Aquificales bacterium]